jgi:neutral ceramidase
VKRAAWILVLWAGCAQGGVSDRAGWKAGVARVKITPPGPLWMSGYGNRTKPAEGTLQDLWVKALAIEDPSGRQGVVLTADLVGIDRELSERICRRIGLPRESILIACSHTHTGPMVSTNLECMFDLPPVERDKITDYATFLESAFADAAAKAIRSTLPAELSFGNGTARFAVNRRNNPEKEVPERIERGELKGPVDYDVPVLRITRAGGPLLAVLFGYACHNTVLDFYQWSGDYAGFAQVELEKAHPGATALFFMGCGADQNPLPRRKVELAEEYGHRLAAGVDRALEGRMERVSGALSARYSLLDLPFARIPAEEDLRKSLEDPKVSERRRAQVLMEQLKRSGRVSPTYAYPVQVWRLGELTLAALGGEVVVDYSLRLKKELDEGRTWVAGYCNDVMAYIPSERVLNEGGYEGGGAMVYYGLPSPWAAGLEDRIVGRVKELAR